MFKDKTVLITGGSGLFGHCFIETVLRDYPGIKKIIIYSRDVQKQDDIAALYPEKQYPQLRFFLGDVRDYERLLKACEGVDIIIHAATLSSLTASEYNPEECIKTNILGAENVINAALKTGVRDVIALSSDKSCAPLSLYGATQLVSDKLFVAANNIKGSKEIHFSVVRYGNVLSSRGSVAHIFLKKKHIGGKSLPITDKRMTRFLISNQQVVETVLFALENHLGGEIFIPKMSSYHITDLAIAIAPDMELQEIGIRPGEKIHEELIAVAESLNTIDSGDYFVIVPSMTYTGQRSKIDYMKHYNASEVGEDFRYTSNENTKFETVESLRAMVKLFVNQNFKI